MDKAHVVIRKNNLIMDMDDAIALFKILNKCQAEYKDYDYVPANEEEQTKAKYLYYVEPIKELVELTSVNNEDYAMMKLYSSTREVK